MKLYDEWVPLKYFKYLLNGLRTKVLPQRIWNIILLFYLLHDCISEDLDWNWIFSLNITGIQNCRWRHVHHRLKSFKDLHLCLNKWSILIEYQTFREITLRRAEMIANSGGLELRWLYCLTIIGCNFVLNDLLHQTLISYSGPWFTFSFMHIWWHHDDVIKFLGKSYFFYNSLFWKNGATHQIQTLQAV